MYFLVYGEGNSDIGFQGNNPGPLICALEKLAETVSEEVFSFDYVSRSELGDIAKSIPKDNKSMRIRGKMNSQPGIILVRRQAQALAIKAKAITDTGVVLFHDCDYSAKIKNGQRYYEEMVKAAQDGFKQAVFSNGVPMIPNPRSESWLLCHYQEEPYKNGNYFENLPANDSASGSGKNLLAQFFNCKISEVYRLHIQGEDIDWNRIAAPSFLFFKKRFLHVIQRITHQNITIPEAETLMK